jgi:hypothetical protein
MTAMTEEPRSRISRLRAGFLAAPAKRAALWAEIARKVEYMDMLLGHKADASAALLAHKFSRSSCEMHEELFCSKK